VGIDLDDLRTEAERGSVPAQAILGISYLHGYDISRDTAQAFHWLSRAAERGASRAQAWLGTMYEAGLETAVDLVRARELYERSAERGEFFGCIFLARLLASGKGGPGAEEIAAHWYSQILTMNVEECPEVDEARRYLAARRSASGG
jgi:hypothetical protein